MRILHVTHNYPRWAGDFSGVFLRSLAREQVALGHQVSVLAPHAADTREREDDMGIDVHRYRYGADAQETLAYTGTMHEIVRGSWGGRLRFVLMLAALWRATRRIVRETSPDVVHVHWWFPNGVAAWPIRPRGGARVVMTVHGTDVFLLSAVRALRPLARAILRSADRVSAVSAALATDVRALGVTVDRVIPMPLDWSLHAAPRAQAPTGAPRLLFVGRLSAQKGVDDLLRATALLVPRHPGLRVTIVGDGAERATLEALVTELGIGAAVEFAGTRPPDETARRYREATALVIPSTTGAMGEREGFGLVAVEGMLAGLPVVATATGGLVDIIEDGRTGLLVPERDPAALAGAIVRLFNDPGGAIELGLRGRALALGRYAPAALAAAFVGLYERSELPTGRAAP